MQPAAETLLQNLVRRHEQLAEALSAQAWPQVALIDKDIKVCLQQIARQGTTSPELDTAKRRLQELHQRALQACAQACEDLRQVLESHRQHGEGRTAYQQVDLLQGER